jgi:hypothetical protein
MDRVENTVHCCTPVVSVGTSLFVKELLSNGCVYLLIKNLFHSSDVVSRSLPSNGLRATICYDSLNEFDVRSLQIHIY